MDDAELRDRVRRIFPITGPTVTLELASRATAGVIDGEPIEVRDGVLFVTMRLVVRDEGAIRDVKEQELELLPARHHTARGIAFLEAVAAHVATIPRDVLEMLMPHELFPVALLDVPGLPPEAFAQALRDPRTRRILEVRPEDAALLATVGRPRAPSLANPELEARIAEELDGADPRASYAVYGDWLAEHGDPRGELVAIQLALETAPEDRELRARERSLLEDHAYEWSRELAWAPVTEVSFTWRRGFLHGVRFGVESVESEPNTLHGDFALRELARLGGTRFVRRVELLRRGYSYDAAVYEAVFEAMGEVGLPPSTTELSIMTDEHQGLGNFEPAYPALANLRTLRIESRWFELGTIELPSLHSLELVTRGLTRDNLTSLRAARWSALERMILWLGDVGVHECDVELEDLDWILAGDGLPAVRELGLCGREPRPLLERLIDAPILRQLRVLDLAGSYSPPGDASWVREHASAFAHLDVLRLPGGAPSNRSSLKNVVIDGRFIPVYE